MRQRPDGTYDCGIEWHYHITEEGAETCMTAQDENAIEECQSQPKCCDIHDVPVPCEAGKLRCCGRCPAWRRMSEARWIPVTEALPQPEKEGKSISASVLIFADGEHAIGFYSTISGWHEYGGELGGTKIDDACVTHWMPLPEVPDAIA